MCWMVQLTWIGKYNYSANKPLTKAITCDTGKCNYGIVNAAD